MKKSDYYSVMQAADAIACSTTYVYKLLRDGVLPDYREGSQTFDINQRGGTIYQQN